MTFYHRLYSRPLSGGGVFLRKLYCRYCIFVRYTWDHIVMIKKARFQENAKRALPVCRQTDQYMNIGFPRT